MCESYKYFNELIEEYCQQNNIDINQFVANGRKNRAEIRKREKEKNKARNKRRREQKSNGDGKTANMREGEEQDDMSSDDINEDANTFEDSVDSQEVEVKYENVKEYGEKGTSL